MKNCFVLGTVVDGAWKIEDAVLGSEVRTWLPGESGYAESWPVAVTVREREVGLVQETEGARAEVRLLRSESWFVRQEQTTLPARPTAEPASRRAGRRCPCPPSRG